MRSGSELAVYLTVVCLLCVMVGGCDDSLLFYILAISKVISGMAPTCDSAHAWKLYSAASLEDQAAITMM